jgi:hypothetical protein
MPNNLLKDSINKVLKNLMRKKGDIFAEIASNWKKIAGENIYYQTFPYNIKYYKTHSGKFASLELGLTNKANILELKFMELQIIERINTYLGYIAITKIVFRR